MLSSVIIIIIIIIKITILIWRPSWSSDHSRRTLTHVNFLSGDPPGDDFASLL